MYTVYANTPKTRTNNSGVLCIARGETPADAMRALLKMNYSGQAHALVTDIRLVWPESQKDRPDFYAEYREHFRVPRLLWEDLKYANECFAVNPCQHTAERVAECMAKYRADYEARRQP